jgi:hypothetical protein
MRKVIRASLLVLVLSCPAYAGYIPNNSPGTPDPQPTPTTQSTTQEAADGYIPNDLAAESEATAAETMLELLQDILSLF